MHKLIIADTSCLIILSKINELELLNSLYDSINITSEIAIEFGENLPDWIQIFDITNKDKQRILELQIDKGEASAIALAMEYENSLLIIDDMKARKIASQLNLNYSGTLGVIIKAKLNGKIKSIKPIIEKIKASDFRISNELFEIALIEANEI